MARHGANGHVVVTHSNPAQFTDAAKVHKSSR
jgi:hypothetical protein